jgi:hypothetical protein
VTPARKVIGLARHARVSMIKCRAGRTDLIRVAFSAGYTLCDALIV